MDRPTVTIDVMNVKIGEAATVALNYCRKAVSDFDADERHPWMGCVKIEENRIIATDGFRMHVAELTGKKVMGLPVGIFRVEEKAENGWAQLIHSNVHEYPSPELLTKELENGIDTSGIESAQSCSASLFVNAVYLRKALYKSDIIATTIEVYKKILVVRYEREFDINSNLKLTAYIMTMTKSENGWNSKPVFTRLTPIPEKETSEEGKS
jgi:hypothetical protein